MLSISDLRTLEVGDVVEAGTLFAGMTKEPLKLAVAAVEDSTQPAFKMTFDASYFGVRVGLYQVAVADEKASWARIEAAAETFPAPEAVP